VRFTFAGNPGNNRKRNSLTAERCVTFGLSLRLGGLIAKMETGKWKKGGRRLSLQYHYSLCRSMVLQCLTVA
jgi:hypothetical protein